VTRAKAIRAKCLDCSNHRFKEVRLCPVIDCPLWPYRHGRGYEDPLQKDLSPDSDFDSERKSG
jgi:hypothetical protein